MLNSAIRRLGVCKWTAGFTRVNPSICLYPSKSHVPFWSGILRRRRHVPYFSLMASVRVCRSARRSACIASRCSRSSANRRSSLCTLCTETHTAAAGGGGTAGQLSVAGTVRRQCSPPLVPLHTVYRDTQQRRGGGGTAGQLSVAGTVRRQCSPPLVPLHTVYRDTQQRRGGGGAPRVSCR